jgi:hypothetical protein
MDDPLSDAVALWFTSVPNALLMKIVDGLHKFKAKYGDSVPVGTAFSGCDIAMKVMDRIQIYVNTEYDIGITFTHAWACERDEEKQKFLIDQMRPPLLFTDFGDLQGCKAHDLVSMTQQLVPWVVVFVAGFPCQAKSQLNRSRSQHTTCVQDGTASTGL